MVIRNRLNTILSCIACLYTIRFFMFRYSMYLVWYNILRQFFVRVWNSFPFVTFFCPLSPIPSPIIPRALELEFDTSSSLVLCRELVEPYLTSPYICMSCCLFKLRNNIAAIIGRLPWVKCIMFLLSTLRPISKHWMKLWHDRVLLIPLHSLCTNSAIIKCCRVYSELQSLPLNKQ